VHLRRLLPVCELRGERIVIARVLLAALLVLAATASAASEHVPAYEARFGRSRPVIAVVGENAGTELTDFVIPFGVLRRSGAAEVLAVATQPQP
jgi:hypothetical protein